MHDIEVLEERWIKYRQAKRKPYYMAIFFILALGGGLFYYINVLHRSFSVVKDTNVSVSVLLQEKAVNPIVIKEEKPFLRNKPILSIQTIKISHKVKPMIPITEHINSPVLPVVNDIPVIEEKKPITQVLKIHENKKPQLFKPKKKNLKIIKISNKRAYKEVEKRFKRFHDVDDALFLARVYYKNSDYKKAEKWALKTNKLNNRLEESWIIFAKSKIKQGKIEEAKHILLNYIKKSDSQKAKNLLYKIRK